MKRFSSLIAVVGLFFTSFSTTFVAAYTWDDNGTSPGFFTGIADGEWSTSATQWTTDPAGLASPIVWTDSNNAVFSVNNASGAGGADVDALVGVPAAVTVGTAGSMSVDGWVALGPGTSTTGNVTIGTGGLTINPNSKLTLHAIAAADAGIGQYPGVTISIPAYTGVVAMGANKVTIKSGGILGIANIGQMTFSGVGGVILDGGTISGRQNAPTSSTFAAAMSVTIAANTGIGTMDTPDPVTTGLWSPTGSGGIFGEGGTANNGGAGTLVKTGAGELRLGANPADFTFKKLKVVGTGFTGTKVTGTTTAEMAMGSYRLGNGTRESTFGAVPLAPLADAIRLENGGMIGNSNFNFSLHPYRGVTIGAGGGGSWGGGGGSILINGILSGTEPLILGSNGPNVGGFVLNNPANTFTGDLILRGGTLSVNYNYQAAKLYGNAVSSTVFGQVAIAPGKSFTLGTSGNAGDGNDWGGKAVGAAGTFNKNGSGTLNLTSAEWVNLGKLNINEGTIRFGAATTGFGDATNVFIDSDATLDMNSMGDGFGGLSGTGSVINHNATTGANLSLRGAEDYTFGGTIAGSGLVTVSGAPNFSFRGSQTFTNTNTYSGGTNVKGGKLLVNAASGTGSGAVNVTGGVLGGAGGSIDGAITVGTGTFTWGCTINTVPNTKTVNTNGRLTGGTGTGGGGILTANSTVTINSGGALEATLGAAGSSDRVKVLTAGAVTLNAGGLLTVNGASSGISGTYTVFEHNGLAAGTVGTLNLNNATGFDRADLAPLTASDSGSAFTVNFGTNPIAQNRSWLTDGNGNWSAASADGANWTGGAGGQANGPGATAAFGSTGAATTHTVTITDSHKTLGTLNLNAADYTIASTASSTHRLVMDTYSGDAAINVATGNHTISAILNAKRNTNVSVTSGSLSVTGGFINDGGLHYSGAGTLTVDSSGFDKMILNNAVLENSGTGTMNINISGTGVDSLTVASQVTGEIGYAANSKDGVILNSGNGNLNITISGTGDRVFANNGTIRNSGGGILTISGNSTQISAEDYSNDVLLQPNLIRRGNLTGGEVAHYENTGSGTMNITGNITNTVGMVVSNSAGGSMTFSGVISSGIASAGSGPGLGDASNIYVQGAGTVIFSGANTHVGRYILQSGKMQISADTNLGNNAINGGQFDGITFDGGTLLTKPTAALTIGAGRGMYAKTTGTIETADFDVTFGGRIHGTGTLTKTGAQTLNLTGESITYDGNLNVNQGVLAVTNTTSLGTTVGNTTVVSGAALNVSGTAAIAEAITLNGTGIASAGALHHIINNKTLSGAITLGSSGVEIQSDANTLTLTGGVSGAGNPNVTFDVAGAITVQTAGINIGTGTLTKEGATALRLDTANTMGAFAYNAGIVKFNDSNSAGGAGVVITVGSAATEFSVTGGFFPVLPNNIVLNSGSNVQFYAASGGSLTLNGVISGLGGAQRRDTGAVNPVINGNNTFGGGFTVVSRGVTLGHKNALGAGTFTIGEAVTAPANPILLDANTNLSGANSIGNAVRVNHPFTMSGSNAMEFSGAVTLDNIGSGASKTITATNTAGAIISGAIGQSVAGLGITKAGSQKLTLMGNNTYDGGTIVSAGNLEVSGASAKLGTGNVTVNGTTAGTFLSILSGVGNAIANTATLSLFGGGTAGLADQGYIDLGAGINDTVASLLLNGVAQAAGTYGSTLSGATFQNNEYFAGTGIITIPSAGVTGDYTGDGFVNAADYVTWRKDTTNGGGDPVGYVKFRENFVPYAGGNQAGAGLDGPAAVPEPSSIALVLLGIAALAGRRRVR